MYRKFKSISHEAEIGYAYDSQGYDVRARFDQHFRVFQTYNDGLCQHSGDWSVGLEHLADYLASLALAMTTDDELAQELYFTMHRRPNEDKLYFAASLIYKKPKDESVYVKPRYFSIEEEKISSNPEKRYDKRYQELREFHDGSPMSIFRMVTEDWHSGLQKYITAEAVRDWANENDAYMELAAVFLEWFKGDPAYMEKARALRDAYEACKNITEAYRLRENVKSTLENFRRHAERAAAKKAEEATAKIAAAASQEVSNA